MQFRKYLDSVGGTFWLQIDGNEDQLEVLAEKLSWLNYATPTDEPVRLLAETAQEADVDGQVGTGVTKVVGTLDVPDWNNAEQVEGELYGGKITELFIV